MKIVIDVEQKDIPAVMKALMKHYVSVSAIPNEFVDFNSESSNATAKEAQYQWTKRRCDNED